MALFGATGPNLTVANVNSNNVGSYSVSAAISNGLAFSIAASLALAFVPTISVQPTNVSVIVDEAASVGVVADGTAPLSYQWFKDGAAVAGAQGATLSIPCVDVNEIGGGILSSSAMRLASFKAT